MNQTPLPHMSSEPTPLQWLMDWCRDRRGGTWLRFNGIGISTTYEHGWFIQVDVVATPLAGFHAAFASGAPGDDDWYEYGLDGERFHGSGDVGKLEVLIGAFRTLWEMAADGTLRNNDEARRAREAEYAKQADAYAQARTESPDPPDSLMEHRYLEARELWRASGAMTLDEERRMGNCLFEMDRIAGQIRMLLREKIIPATLAGDLNALADALIMYDIRLWELQEFGYLTDFRRLIDDITPRLYDDK